MTRIVIHADAPWCSTGFTRSAEQIAGALHGLEVAWLIRSDQPPPPHDFPWPIHVARCRPENPSFWPQLAAATREAIGAGPVTMVSIGPVRDQLALLQVIQEEGLRERVHAVSYLPIDFAPVTPLHVELIRTVDRLVPVTEFARRALLAAVEGDPGAAARFLQPIPHGVDTTRFAPLSPEERTQVRRDRFGVDDGMVLVGFFSRNTSRKRPDLALRIFHHWHRGTYSRCGDCDRLTASEFDPVDLSPVGPTTCYWCGARNLVRGSAHSGTRFYLHSELLGAWERRCFGGYKFDRLVELLGLGDAVTLEPALRPGVGLPVAELARRMAACDLQLLPYTGGGWELTILEAAACGLPSIITDHAAPPAYAAPCCELVPVASHHLQRFGVQGIMDVHAGLEALARLASSPERRQDLGRRGLEVASRFRVEEIGPRWRELLGAPSL